MIISKLELERYINAYEIYKQDNEEQREWSTTREYLSINGLYDVLDIIEDCVNIKATQEQIEQVLVVLGVEVRWTTTTYHAQLFVA